MDTIPLAYTIAEACTVARTGRTALYELIRSGELPARKRGRRTIILAEDLQRWIKGLPIVDSAASGDPVGGLPKRGKRAAETAARGREHASHATERA
jgi:excisionase family DNA binding protein